MNRFVLIYPYWNVNNCPKLTISTSTIVLIYPYWNVNVYMSFGTARALEF